MSVREPRRSLDGMTVLVTGAGNGVGRATAIGAAARGATVSMLDRDGVALADALREVRAVGGRAEAFVADITRELEVRDAFERTTALTGRLDAVLHSAGIMLGQRLDIREMSEDTWDRVIAVNLKGSFFIAKHAAVHMVPRGRGTIVLVASRSGITLPSGSVAYGASKGGINGFSMSLAKQLASKGVRVLTLCPGDIDTPLMRASLDEALRHGIDPAEAERIRATLGTADDVAKALLHLADPEAETLSGTIFTA